MRTLCLAALVLVSPVSPARAAFTEVAPAGVVLVDERWLESRVTHQWNNDGEVGPLIDEVVRYEPGGGLQGTIIPNVEVRYRIWLSTLAVGITDQLSALVAIPLVVANTVEPRLGWIPGDYSATLGRAYSEEDFWSWARSMGQKRPDTFSGNRGKLGDIVVGGRWRFSDGMELFADLGVVAAVTAFGALPTGVPPDPEELVASGTTSWNLYSQGELGLHLSFDTVPIEALDRRVVIGLDLFHELFLPRRYDSSTGAKNPLLLNNRAYVGDTYEIDPGDFTGFEVGIDLTLIRGAVVSSRLVGGDEHAALALPPLLSVGLRYNATFIGQSDWTSNSPLWDWDQEKFWRPGYKNIVQASTTVSLLRLGIPVQLYGSWRNLTLLPGKNCRAPSTFALGAQVPLRLW